MDDVTRTHTITQMATEAAHPRVWCLSIVHHGIPAYLGRRVILQPGSTLAIGRDCALFGEADLGDSRISREHAKLKDRMN